MSKLDNLIINDIKMLSLDMINEAGSGNANLVLSSGEVFYSLFMNNLIYNPDDKDWVNRDRLFVSDKLLPVLYSTLHMFGINNNIDNLREFKKLDSKLPSYLNNTNIYGDIIGYAVGTSLGERYIESLINIEDAKNELINFNTYCVCTYEDLISGIAHENLSFINYQNLNKLTIIVIKDKYGNELVKDDVYKDDLSDWLESMDFEVINVKSNNLGAIDNAIDNAKDSKSKTIIIVEANYNKELIKTNLNRILTSEELSNIRCEFKMDLPFEINEQHYKDVREHISKRLSKIINKWDSKKDECLKDIKIKNIYNFLLNKEININYNVDNIKINDNYEEELINGNSKIFNLLASKSPYILSISNDNFNNTLCSIKSSKIMNKSNPTERNIECGGRILAMGCIAIGLGELGFKVFVSAPLINANILKPFIKNSSEKELNIHYVFTHDTFLNMYEDNGIGGLDEINSLRLIPKLINFRPCDINEIIGVYNILANYNKCSSIVVGSLKTQKLIGTNPKYVVAGAYRVKKEHNEPNGIIIATGSEVTLAIRVAEELLPYGIDFRVVSMPCEELFNNQSEKYKHTLLPKNIKTFVLEFGSTALWSRYATDEDYILGIDRFTTCGTKEELLNKYDLNIDGIKTRIINIIKNN